MFHVFDDYTNRFKIPARDFNALAKFCNSLSPGTGINIRRPDRPSHSNPVQVSVNPQDLFNLGFPMRPAKKSSEETNAHYAAWATPEDVAEYVESETDAEKIARIGTSRLAAPLDHQHRMPFGINPLKTGDDGENNVASEEVYLLEEDEDISQIDLSGTSQYAARADHTHPMPADGVSVSERVVYENIYSPSGTSHYYGTKVVVTIKSGLVTRWESQGVFDLFTGDAVTV